MNSEDISNYASAIQSVFLSLAVLVGGGWAIYKFFSLKEVSRARAELRKRELEAKQSPLLNIDIQVTVGREPGDASQCAVFDVLLQNPSTTAEVIRWNDHNVSLHSVHAGDGDALSIADEIPLLHGSVNSGTLISSAIAAGENGHFCFVAKLAPGLYLFEFRCEVVNALDDIKEIHDKASIEPGTIMWSSSKFFQVPRSAAIKEPGHTAAD